MQQRQLPWVFMFFEVVIGAGLFGTYFNSVAIAVAVLSVGTAIVGAAKEIDGAIRQR